VCWEGRRPSVRWKSDVWRNAEDLLLIHNWKAAARNREDCWMLVVRGGGVGLGRKEG